MKGGNAVDARETIDKYPVRIPDDDAHREWTIDEIPHLTPGSMTCAYLHEIGTRQPYIGMHVHCFYEINIITEGHGRHYIGDNSLSAAAGDVFIMPPGVRHGFLPEGRMLIFHLILGPAFMERYRAELHGLQDYALLFEVEPYLRSVRESRFSLRLAPDELQAVLPELERIEVLCASTDPTAELMRNGYALYVTAELISYMERQRHAESPTDEGGRTLQQVAVCMEYINSHLTERIRIDTLCRLSAMSPSTLYRAFRRICGMPPCGYQLLCRINTARQLLLNTDRTVLDVALSCGFFDSSHFIRVFTESVGMTPARFRLTAGRIPGGSAPGGVPETDN